MQRICVKCGYNILYGCHRTNFEAAMNLEKVMREFPADSLEMKAAGAEVNNTRIATAALAMIEVEK